jgi:uncharacterized integral membrane protein
VRAVSQKPRDPGYEDEPTTPARRPTAWLIGVLIVGVLTLLFITRNRRRVKVDFVFFDSQARTWVVILLAMALGGLLTELIRLGLKRRRASRT